MGVLCPVIQSGRPNALRPASRRQPHPPPSPARAGQPPRRHPARLPAPPRPLQRAHRLGAPHASGRLTLTELGCLTSRDLPQGGPSHTFRLTAFRRPACFTTSRLFAPNSPKFCSQIRSQHSKQHELSKLATAPFVRLQWCNPAARSCVIPVDADADCQRRRNRFDHLTPSRTRSYFRCPATTSKPR